MTQAVAEVLPGLTEVETVQTNRIEGVAKQLLAAPNFRYAAEIIDGNDVPELREYLQRTGFEVEAKKLVAIRQNRKGTIYVDVGGITVTTCLDD